MLIHKGFIKVHNGSFYPISRITEIRPRYCSPACTEIVFDDGKIVRNSETIIKTIDEIDKINNIDKD